jgi:hypothetical protein
VAALVTPFEMAAESGSPAQFDGAQHTLLPHGQRWGMRLAKLVAMRAHDVCDFECRPHQRRRPTAADQLQGKEADPMGWLWRRRY